MPNLFFKLISASKVTSCGVAIKKATSRVIDNAQLVT